MAVDLGDLIEAMKREVIPPGSDLYADVSDDRWLGELLDAFWVAVLEGAIVGYTADDDGIITATTAAVDLPRQIQQLVVLFAGLRILTNTVTNADASFKAVAGPVSYERERSSQALQAALNTTKERVARALDAAKTAYFAGSSDIGVWDAVLDRAAAGYWLR